MNMYLLDEMCDDVLGRHVEDGHVHDGHVGQHLLHVLVSLVAENRVAQDFLKEHG